MPTQNNLSSTRLAHLRSQFSTWGVEAVLITNPTNRRWLTGFTGSAGKLLVTAQEAILLIDSRYWQQAAAQAPHCTIHQHKARRWHLADFIKSVGVNRIGIEANTLTLAQAANLKRIEGITWVELQKTAESLRQVKTEAEIETIQQAAALTDDAMMKVPYFVQQGMSEKQLAWQLEKHMRQAGADHAAFDLIVAFGANSALPHHQPSDRLLQEDDIILIDMGAKLNGYHSDLTRTFYFGNTPPDTFWQIYYLVQSAQEAAIRQMRPNMTAKAIDALARIIIEAGGHAAHFGHGLGHGVGLDIHEAPSFSIWDEEAVPAGVVVTIEPGIYIPDWGGVRLEDLGVLTSAGLHLLSHAPKTPIISI